VLFASVAWGAPDDSARHLFQALEQRDLPRVEQMLRSGVSPDVCNPDAPIAFQTPLSWAVSSSDATMVTLLLSYGADIDQRVGFWRDLSPLYLAVKNGNFPLTRQLVEAGARIDPNRWTKLKEFFLAPIDLLRGDVVDLRRPPSLLEAAHQSGNKDLLTFLEQQGAR